MITSFSIHTEDKDNLDLLEKLTRYGKRFSRSRNSIILEGLKLYDQKYLSDSKPKECDE